MAKAGTDHGAGCSNDSSPPCPKSQSPFGASTSRLSRYCAVKIQILSGSFHAKSQSLRIARFLKHYLGEHGCEIPQLDALPFYSEDLAHNKPDNVCAFLEGIKNCDAIICVTPEYNHSVPAVLKNAIDWASRPAFHSPLKGKPVAIISQAEGPVGGARAQAHLKLILDSTLSILFPCHEMMIANVNAVVTEDCDISDANTKRRIVRHTDDFVAFARAFTDSD